MSPAPLREGTEGLTEGLAPSLRFLRRVEERVHHRRAARQHWPELLPVHRLGHRRAAVPDHPGDSSTGTPASLIIETNEFRSSRGVHSHGSSPASLHTDRKDRRTFAASKAVPLLVANTNPSWAQ